MSWEIERKFLVGRDFPWNSWVPGTLYRQGYLPSEGNQEVRLRREGFKTKITIKSGAGMERREWEVSIRSVDFNRLWPDTLGRRVEKVRHRGIHQGQAWELDVYRGTLEGLRTLEMEFSGREEARRFRFPSLRGLGPEITWDPRYKNSALAQGSEGLWLSPPAGNLVPEMALGVLPFQRDKDSIRLVGITTRRGDRWIVPKGQPEPGLSWEMVAHKEALEEAGIRGRIVGHPVLLPYKKEGGTCNLILFPLEVDILESKWEEQSLRRRSFFTPGEVKSLEGGTLLQTCIQVVESLYGPTNGNTK